MSKFIDKSRTITLYSVLAQRIPYGVMTKAAKSEGISELIQRKLPCINAVVVDGDTEQ